MMAKADYKQLEVGHLIRAFQLRASRTHQLALAEAKQWPFPRSTALAPLGDKFLAATPEVITFHGITIEVPPVGLELRCEGY